MKNKGILLVVVFVVLAGVASLVVPKPDSGQRDGVKQGDAVLSFDGAAIQRIEVKSPALELTVTQSDQGWIFPGVADFPADVERLRSFVNDLTELKVANSVIGGEGMLDEFGLGNAARTVELKDASGTLLASLRVGDARESASAAQGPMGFSPGGDGTYVRAGDGPVVLADGSLYSLPSRQSAWMDTQLTSIQASDIERIRVSIRDEAPYELEVDGGSSFTLVGMSTNLTLDSTKAGGLARAFQYLSFEEVDGVAVPTNVTATLEVTCVDGVRLTVQVSEQAGNTLYRHHATYEEPTAPTREEVAKDIAEDAEDRDSKVNTALESALTAHQSAVEAAKAKVEALNARAAWTYRLSSYSAGNLMTSRSDLEKEPEPDENTLPETP